MTEEERLQSLLSVYRHDAPRRPTRAAWGALTAAVCAVVGIGLWQAQGPRAWSTDTASCKGCRWEVGALLDTTQPALARLEHRGRLRALPGTKVRREPGEGAHLALLEGTMQVWVDAPPEWLSVQLPGVELVDLGCAFEVRVAASGHGAVWVETGAVALRGVGPETVVPAGTMAASWPDGHTGLTVSQRADEAFVAVVDTYDRGGGDWRPVLQAAGIDDAVTVWHLLDRAPDRAAVVNRLADLLGAQVVARDRLLRDETEAELELLAYIVGRTL
ncbi:MAG: hypothetical protein KTR31_31080 [Myxococcales bacterium]|nr:hypothetical protein [Myxococcales bacterium]